ncbi:MAG TPA: 4'-phosphopantetheinyl transferase superfamily protein [Candidatus Solibacter sp.]|nr:4'-phosphopantetheinyl transferase superfamily protein [Candidatus Solibacter sp.]
MAARRFCPLGIDCHPVAGSHEKIGLRATEVNYLARSESLPSPPDAPPLQRNEDHLWQFPLEVSEYEKFADLLSEDERQRASRFHFEVDRRRFSVARASVRAILGSYSSTDPRELAFTYSAQGKPSLDKKTDDIRFNVSHSGGLGLLAVTLAREIGADIEAMRPDVETDKLAQRFFSPHERETLCALPARERVSAFYRCWTSKEAFLKGDGVGLSRSLSSFDVEVNPQRPASLLATRPDEREKERWYLHDINTDAGYAAAVAVEGVSSVIRVFRCRE